MVEERKLALDAHILTQPTFDAWHTLSQAMILPQPQIHIGTVDGVP